MAIIHHAYHRRRFLKTAAAIGGVAALELLAPAWARQSTGNLSGPHRRDGNTDIFDLAVRRTTVTIDGRKASAITVNDTLPAPLIRLREGRDVIINLTNHLDEPGVVRHTSIHWHGILLPPDMDGVPGLSFAGVQPGETYTYRYPVRQSGTYWYHSHSGLQEQIGHYGPLIIDPAGDDPYGADRDYVVMLSDWTFDDPMHVFANLKKAEGYYNFQKRTVADLADDVRDKGWAATWKARSMWAQMRMSSRDLLDVTGHEYTYLMNGLAPESNWTGLFRPGERVRLRFINAAAMTFFDVRIPGLKMTVIEADGQPVQPVPVDEFRIGVAETYDVIVEPRDEQAYTVFAEAMDRSGFGAGTLAPRAGMRAPLPARRPTPERGMDAMGMSMDMSRDMAGHSMNMPMKKDAGEPMGHGGMHYGMSHGHKSMPEDPVTMSKEPAVGGGGRAPHGPDQHGPGAAMVAMHPQSRLHEPGVGLEDAGHRVLVYTDLRSPQPWPDQRVPGREIELHLTGNMERYLWSFDGKKFSEVDGPILFKAGERLRLTLVNDTMMEHPIHLHGMWMYLVNGAGPLQPRKHTITVKPAETVSLDITVDAPHGDWAFHCHLLYHMEAGMFRVVRVV